MKPHASVPERRPSSTRSAPPPGSRAGPLRRNRRILREQGMLRWTDVHAGYGTLPASMHDQRRLSLRMLFRRRRHRPLRLRRGIPVHLVLRKGGRKLHQARRLLHRSLQYRHERLRLAWLPAAMHQEHRLLHRLLRDVHQRHERLLHRRPLGWLWHDRHLLRLPPHRPVAATKRARNSAATPPSCATPNASPPPTVPSAPAAPTSPGKTTASAISSLTPPARS